MPETQQEKDYQFFLENKKELCRKYPDQFIVIRNGEVIGVYPDQVTALTETTQTHEPGTFIIQQASADAIEPQVFHSRITRV